MHTFAAVTNWSAVICVVIAAYLYSRAISGGNQVPKYAAWFALWVRSLTEAVTFAAAVGLWAGLPRIAIALCITYIIYISIKETLGKTYKLEIRLIDLLVVVIVVAAMIVWSQTQDPLLASFITLGAATIAYGAIYRAQLQNESEHLQAWLFIFAANILNLPAVLTGEEKWGWIFVTGQATLAFLVVLLEQARRNRERKVALD